jgi:membrane associated rhomboid family serine protease
MSQAQPDRDNFCYRHPDRQSFVLCQRCGRTICGECQTPAAVGVVCPECMAEQRRSAPRQVRPTILTASSEAPVVTYAIIAICAVVYVLQLVTGNLVTNALSYAGAYSMPGIGVPFEPWRMLTAAFVHGNFLHLALNLYTLFLFGRILEPMLGRVRYLALYLLSALGGSLAVMFLASPFQGVVGASGAIFGLMGAFLVIQRRLGGDMTGLLVLVGINLVIGFVPGFGISWQAHLGGLVVGAIIGLILFETRRRNQKNLQIGLLVAVAVVLVAVSLTYVFV